MSTSNPVELAVNDVLQQAAAGGALEELLLGVVLTAERVMGPGVVRAAVVLADPDAGLVVRASSRQAPGEPRVPVDHELLLTGPAATAARSGATTVVADTAGPATGRWPQWTTSARGAGVRGARCWPVRVADVPVGALVVLHAEPWVRSTPFDPSDGPSDDTVRAPFSPTRSSATGQALSDLCAVVLQLPPVDQRWSQALLALRSTVDGSVAVHQAVGMVAAAHDVDIPTAATALAAAARRRGVSAEALARQLASRTLSAREVPLTDRST